jgi:hypothetical protein
MIDISDVSDHPSPDWSSPRRRGASAGVEGTRSLFPQAPPVPGEIIVVAPKPTSPQTPQGKTDQAN